MEYLRLIKIGDMYYLAYAARVYAPGQYWLVEYVEGVSKALTDIKKAP